ncbi:type I pullulanase [Alkalicoccobacillus plakortidis]|uniref:Type I pullulanase n=1 Tax=Alkalicoccobacillus plakortidis TaxID=444060 RepID=A0ABT0XHI4_9BACI|nr:type I pullulanase [Alkalicoccobacillus plakortidis]MCM2675337.1 type I pullulanase [Alkalicoccobacillus plakortidis]
MIIFQSLGITHVQLMPVQEFSTVDESNQQATYNWGYDTNHFFSLEGSYSENPYSGYSRVQELRETVDAFHKKGIRVILDVIYNHVFIWEKSALELLVPGYYFRYASNGKISNGTGVGNDMATERSMARKLIIDSVTYLMTEFDLDGLRFDLMGIIDLETMKQISETVVKFKNDFLLLGEGWRLHTAYPQDRLATLDQATQLPTVAFFDDQFRDLLKGSIFSTHSGGFGQTKSNPLALRDAISGGPSQFVLPTQAIHYVEVHDNQTLWDRLVQLHPTEKNEVLESRHALATSMILLSQGIPFIHAGQEWCRTKYGQENSYSDPDWVNQLNWNRRTTYDHYNRFVTGLIKLRQAYPVFSMATFADISKKIKWFICDSDFLMYQLTSKCKNNAYSQKIIVVHNGTSEKRLLNCKVSGIWQVCVDGKAASLVPLYSLRGEELIVSPLSTMVCMQ